jgi:hypothetical protein
MKVSRKYYTGPFCNYTAQTEAAFFENPVNTEFLNPDYPYLNQFHQTVYCLGISLWKIEPLAYAEYAANLDPEKIHQLITSSELLGFQMWEANGMKGIIKEIKAPARRDLVNGFASSLYQAQPLGDPRPKVTRKVCESMVDEFLDSIEAESGKIIHFFNIGYGWSNWFALDSHYDYGSLMVTENALWLLTFSESD